MSSAVDTIAEAASGTAGCSDERHGENGGKQRTGDEMRTDQVTAARDSTADPARWRGPRRKTSTAASSRRRLAIPVW